MSLVLRCFHTARAAGVALLVSTAPAWAQPAASAATAIYSCVDALGRRLTSDRPIIDCSRREQRMLNRDGSVRRVIPPTLTAEERERGVLALRAHLDAEVGGRRRVLAETHERGRTEQFTTVQLSTPAAPGTILNLRIIGHDGRQLLAG